MDQNELGDTQDSDETAPAGPDLPGSPSTGPDSNESLDPDVDPDPVDDADPETNGAG